jgi:deazaflavin-dependent oxidoreductase (nitroreductase family)
MIDGPAQQRATTMRFQGAANAVVRGLLRTPLLGRVIGQRLVVVYVTGRKTGKRYAVPVAYTRHGDDLLIGTPFGWGRNLRTGEPVTIRTGGRPRTADVRVYADEEAVTRWFGLIARDNKQFAAFNKIGYDANGEPNAEDLRLAWRAGARAILLTPR